MGDLLFEDGAMKLRCRLLVYTLVIAGLLAVKSAQQRVDLSVVFGDEPCPRCAELHYEWEKK